MHYFNYFKYRSSYLQYSTVYTVFYFFKELALPFKAFKVITASLFLAMFDRTNVQYAVSVRILITLPVSRVLLSLFL
jgi:hypothetical protein